MACIEVSLARLERVRAETARLERVAAALARLERVRAETARLERMAATLARLERVRADVNLVCYVGGILYLRVSPTELQWVTEEMAAVYSVESNTTWNVQ